MTFRWLAVAAMAVCGMAGAQQQAAPPPAVERVTIEPAHVTLAPGDAQVFSARVIGSGTLSGKVTWAVNGKQDGSAALGTIDRSGRYVTPYPAPATVTVTATSVEDATRSASATVEFAGVPQAAGPALTVDARRSTHAIDPMIYGMNAWRLFNPNQEALKVAKAVRLPLNRWGGDGDTRYNWKLDVSNSGDDWYFETVPNRNTQYPDVSEFNTQVMDDKATGAKTLAQVPAMGWVAKSRTHTSGFRVSKYGPQKKTDPFWKDFGNGVKPSGAFVTGNDPADTSMAVDESWTAEWVKYLVGRFGNAASGGVAMYALDNEPTWWDKTHRDVHPDPFTYDEVTEKGLKTARAIKAADPTAEVTGPVIDFWLTYFYSKQDVKAIWGHMGSVSAAADRKAHGDVPLIEYYLRAFKKAQDADPAHTRLLDYLDLHTYFAANDAGLKPAGNSEQQRAVLDSTRVFWDTTYANLQFRDPDNFFKPAAPAIIRRMKQWVAADYPGTKTAITEYAWGGGEHISGAVAEADILGIFGREGLDLGALWGPPNLNTPLMFAFKMYRNYDDAGGEFGDGSLTAASADQGKLAVYAARRSSDHALTVMVVNKTFGDLRSDVGLEHLKTKGAVQVYQYSGADLGMIRRLADRKAGRVGKGSVVAGQVFPAMSVTLLVMAGK